jgi:hypothetical protein
MEFRSFVETFLATIYNEMTVYSQDVTNNTNAPYVGPESNLIEIYYFRSNELWRAEQYLQFLSRIVFSRQAKIDYLYSVTFLRQAQDILRLKRINFRQSSKSFRRVDSIQISSTHFQVKMQNLLTVHELYSFAYLAHKNGAATLRQYKIIVYHSFKELAAVDP